MQKEAHGVLSYVRTHRRKWGLTLREMAGLVGLQSSSHFSRIERGKQPPTVEVALACQVIFGIPPTMMFPHVHAQVVENVVRNVEKLRLALDKSTKPADLRKKDLCSQILSRVNAKTRQLQGV